MSACVPKQVFQNKELGYLISEDEIEKAINSIGIYERRTADEDCFASDLCYKIAKQLMKDNDIAPDSIDVLLFVSQCTDYSIPFTVPIL